MPDKVAHALAEQFVAFKEHEAELREELMRYKAVFDVTPCPMVLTDQEGRVVYVNDSYRDMLKLGLEDVADFGWSKAVVDDDRERIVALWKQVVATKLPACQEWVTFKTIGRVFWRAKRLLDGSYAVAIFHPACSFLSAHETCGIGACPLNPSH